MQRTLESVPIPKSFPLDQMRKLAVASGELDFTRIPGAGVVLEDQLDRVIARLRAFHAPFKAVACRLQFSTQNRFHSGRQCGSEVQSLM